MKKRFTIAAGSTVIASLGLVTTSYAGTTPNYNPNATLTIAVSTDAVKLDPQTTADIPSANVFMNIFDNLVTQDAKGNIVPDLATKWTHTSTNWTFTLRKGVRFSNGDKLDANTVKASFDRLLNPSTAAPRASLFSAIDSIKVLNPYKIEFVMKQPFAPFLANLSNYAGGIVDPQVAASEGSSYGQKPVGTGPFELASWQPGNQLVLKPNPYYWGQKPKVSEVIYQVVPDQSTRMSMLESNQAQVMLQVPPAQITTMQHQKGIDVQITPAFGLEYVGFNDQVAPFNNKLVRQALSYATNRQAIVNNVYYNTIGLATGPIPSTVWGHTNAKLQQYPYNVKKAKALLAKAGYPNGFKTTIYVDSGDQTRLAAALILQSEWRALGVQANIQVIEWGTFLQYTATPGKTPVFILGWSDMTGDADYNQYFLWDSKSQGVGGNRDFYSNPQVDKLVEAGRAELNQKKRLQDYAQAQKIEAQDAAAIFLGFDKNVIVTRSTVGGLVMAPSGILYVDGAYVSN